MRLLGTCITSALLKGSICSWQNSLNFNYLIINIKIAIKQYRNVPIHSKVFSDKTKSGGGPLIDLGSHYFDLACWFLNFPKIKSITANNFNNLVKMSKIVKRYLPFEKFSNEEFTTGIINFKNKSTINFEISYLLNVKQNLREIEIYGEKGSIFWPNGNIYFENSYISPLAFSLWP